MSLTTAYNNAVTAIGGERDPAQLAAVESLSRLQRALDAPGPSWWRRAIGRTETAVTGVYLWGGVGRGKTFLMDLFFDELRVKQKRRVHFHRFMRDVHAHMTQIGEGRDPLEKVATRIAESVRVICFDEFFVSDIGDAMILGRLLEKLFARGVVLVATSNIPPASLYKDGLQRARFLPAIALLETHCEVVELASSTDYRLRTLTDAGIYSTECGADSDRRMAGLLEQLAAGRPPITDAIAVHGREIEIRGRTVDAAWFDFAALCDGPRSAADYILLANRFSTIMISDVPVLDDTRNDSARRFIALVDELYDRRVNLLLCAHAAVDALYVGQKLKFEFERTRSRLIEMQSRDYLASAKRTG